MTIEQGVLPQPLRAGDLIAIVSPASKIDAALIDGASNVLQRRGFRVVVMPHAKGVEGSYSGTPQQRYSDLKEALLNADVKAIVCSRGGYGAVHLLERLNELPNEAFNKWLVGFSDVTALHGLWRRKGVASLHGAMTKYLARDTDFEFFERELGMLQGHCEKAYSFNAHPYNRVGECRGTVVGGNLAVLGGLIGTPFCNIANGDILFMEDIAEPIYKVERILWQLRLAGVFRRVAGVMVGQFTDYRPSADFESMELMMQKFFADYHFPVAFNLPCGHIEANHPLLLNRTASLSVTPTAVTLSY
jgi:muramoyltetrapeptide carboxypeptidase